MIGLLTPPYGLLLFILANMTKQPLSAIVREAAPFIGAAVLVLAHRARPEGGLGCPFSARTAVDPRPFTGRAREPLQWLLPSAGDRPPLSGPSYRNHRN